MFFLFQENQFNLFKPSNVTGVSQNHFFLIAGSEMSQSECWGKKALADTYIHVSHVCMYHISCIYV